MEKTYTIEEIQTLVNRFMRYSEELQDEAIGKGEVSQFERGYYSGQQSMLKMLGDALETMDHNDKSKATRADFIEHMLKPLLEVPEEYGSEELADCVGYYDEDEEKWQFLPAMVNEYDGKLDVERFDEVAKAFNWAHPQQHYEVQTISEEDRHTIYKGAMSTDYQRCADQALQFLDSGWCGPFVRIAKISRETAKIRWSAVLDRISNYMEAEG